MTSMPVPIEEPTLTRNQFILRVIEFCILCIALPSIIIVYRLAPVMFNFLWATAVICFLVYRFTYYTNFKTLWNWQAVTWQNMKPILFRFVICAVLMVAFVYVYDPDRLFYLPREKPYLVAFLFFLYPVLSALPQEFIFCTFFFDRYKPFFKSQTAMIIASAIVFAYAHILYINWVAPTLSFFAGLIFAKTYAEHRSLALVTIEHGLYGNWLFIIGLGWYFYGGAVAQ